MAEIEEKAETDPQSDADFFAETLDEKSGAQPRDESGRFATKADETAAAVLPAPTLKQPEAAEGIVLPSSETPPADAKDDSPVPSWRLREVSEARRIAEEKAQQADLRARDLERQFQTLQNQIKSQQPKPEKKPAPDIIMDPQGYHDWQMAEFRALQAEQQTAFQQQQLERDLRRTHMTMIREGKGEEFQAAWEAANASTDPVLKARIRESYDPGQELVEWYRERTAVKEIGGDLSSFLAKKQAEWAKDPKVREAMLAEIRAEASGQKPKGASRPNIVGLPSLSKVPAASREVNTEVDDQEFFNSLPRGNRNRA